MAISTLANGRKQRKPYDGFPLTPRKDGRWQCKRKGRVYYFSGSWEEALQEFKRIEGDIATGDDPTPEEACVKDLLFHFLKSKKQALETGEIRQVTYNDCQYTCKLIRDYFGYARSLSSITANDFAEFRAELAKTRSLHTLSGIISRIRSVFNFGVEHDIVSSVKGLGTFKKPKTKLVNRDRKRVNEELGRGDKVFSREEILAMLDSADPWMRAAILLGVNLGYGNEDVAQLKPSHVKGDHVVFPRPKTGEDREGYLWPETQAALEAVGLPLTTELGVAWADRCGSLLTTKFTSLKQRCGIDRKGYSFYTLRHTFKSIAEHTKDFSASFRVMGHRPPGMAAAYLHWDSNDPAAEERLRAVSEYVRNWLFGDSQPRPPQTEM